MYRRVRHQQHNPRQQLIAREGCRGRCDGVGKSKHNNIPHFILDQFVELFLCINVLFRSLLLTTHIRPFVPWWSHNLSQSSVYIGMYRSTIPVHHLCDTLHCLTQVSLSTVKKPSGTVPCHGRPSTVQNCTLVRARNFVVGRITCGNAQHTLTMDATLQHTDPRLRTRMPQTWRENHQLDNLGNNRILQNQFFI